MNYRDINVKHYQYRDITWGRRSSSSDGILDSIPYTWQMQRRRQQRCLWYTQVSESKYPHHSLQVWNRSRSRGKLHQPLCGKWLYINVIYLTWIEFVLLLQLFVRLDVINVSRMHIGLRPLYYLTFANVVYWILIIRCQCIMKDFTHCACDPSLLICRSCRYRNIFDRIRILSCVPLCLYNQLSHRCFVHDPPL